MENPKSPGVLAVPESLCFQTALFSSACSWSAVNVFALEVSVLVSVVVYVFPPTVTVNLAVPGVVALVAFGIVTDD